MTEADAILSFWFSEAAKRHWFKSTDAFDAEIRAKFETTAMNLAAQLDGLKAASDAQLPEWEDTPDTALALIIALDQFPRNMYRGTPAAFAWDPLALAAAQRLVARGADLRIDQSRRQFAYMPFMHAEDLAAQERCVMLCDARLADNTIDHAIIHRDIIARFGRFPHRNAILGRITTPDEQAYLDEGGFNPA